MLYLTHIKERLAKSTPGPWTYQRPTDLNGRRAYEVGPLGAAPVALAFYDGATRGVPLIAHAPTDLAALIAEVELLRGLIEDRDAWCQAAMDATRERNEARAEVERLRRELEVECQARQDAHQERDHVAALLERAGL